MEGAAGQVARAAVTSEADESALRAFALRRLAAVPDISIFHAGGPLAWEVACARDEEGRVSVSIEGAVSPLPVLGAFVAPFGERDGMGNVVMRAEVSYEGRPAWLEGSYEEWVAAWGS